MPAESVEAAKLYEPLPMSAAIRLSSTVVCKVVPLRACPVANDRLGSRAPKYAERRNAATFS